MYRAVQQETFKALFTKISMFEVFWVHRLTLEPFHTTIIHPEITKKKLVNKKIHLLVKHSHTHYRSPTGGLKCEKDRLKNKDICEKRRRQRQKVISHFLLG